MRPRFSAALLAPLAVLVTILLGAVAAAPVLANDTPGNNGTVKIHDGATEPAPSEVRNEPHVCTFHLHFYFADPEQAGTWEIQQWAPTGQKGTVVLSGTYDTAGDGEDRQPEAGTYSLPDGHYKLFWDGDLDTGKHDKMKVFWVECAPAASSSPSGSEEAIESGSTSPSGSEEAIESGGGESNGSTPPSTGPSGGVGGISGSELPISGAGSPGGGVLGIEGTPPNGVTPPPTDTATDVRGGD